MTMSASFSLKMMRMTIAVTLTGSISGKMICQKVCQRAGAVDLRRLEDFLRQRLQAGKQQDHHERDGHPGVHHLDRQPGDPGIAKKAGLSQPRKRARRATGPKRYSMHRLADHPAHRHRRQHERQQEHDAEEPARPDLGVEEQRQPEGDRVFEEDGQHVEDHVAERVPEERVVPQLRRMLSRPLNCRPSARAEVPVGEGDVEAEDVGKITIATVKRTAGRTKSARWPRSPRISTWPKPRATRPEDIGVEHGPPGREAGRRDAGRVERLEEERRGEEERAGER